MRTNVSPMTELRTWPMCAALLGLMLVCSTISFRSAIATAPLRARRGAGGEVGDRADPTPNPSPLAGRGTDPLSCFNIRISNPGWGKVDHHMASKVTSIKSKRAHKPRRAYLNRIAQGVRLILEGIGEDPNREGLRDTPRRVAEMYEELTQGMRQDPS